MAASFYYLPPVVGPEQQEIVKHTLDDLTARLEDVEYTLQRLSEVGKSQSSCRSPIYLHIGADLS